MITAVNRPAALHINLAAIKENTRQAKGHLKPGQKLFCVVKANAYGHGASRLAPVMEEAGADGFCVAMLDEGLELRRAQIVKPILGLNPSSAPGSRDLEPAFALKPAMSFVSELTYVKQIHKGYGVGYGSTHIAEEDEWIGTVPVGYADGWIRKFQGFKVKVGDTYCPIVGRVCMDQFMVLLPKEVPAGTPVELISADPAAPNSLRRAADWLDTIHYEVACQFNDRLDRIYDNE
jgi:alanine racemase